VLTGCTSLKLLNSVTGTHVSQLICVIFTPVSLPQSLASLSRFQWVDHRRWHDSMLTNLSGSLAGNQADKVLLASETLPTRVDDIVLPEDVRTALFMLRAWLLICACYMGSASISPDRGILPVILLPILAILQVLIVIGFVERRMTL